MSWLDQSDLDLVTMIRQVQSPINVSQVRSKANLIEKMFILFILISHYCYLAATIYSEKEGTVRRGTNQKINYLSKKDTSNIQVTCVPP